VKHPNFHLMHIILFFSWIVFDEFIVKGGEVALSLFGEFDSGGVFEFELFLLILFYFVLFLTLFYHFS
jgi:hypothetical protein